VALLAYLPRPCRAHAVSASLTDGFDVLRSVFDGAAARSVTWPGSARGRPRSSGRPVGRGVDARWRVRLDPPVAPAGPQNPDEGRQREGYVNEPLRSVHCFAPFVIVRCDRDCHVGRGSRGYWPLAGTCEILPG